MTLTKGTLAFWDTAFSGFVPCKVLAVRYKAPGESAALYFDLTRRGISSRYRADIVVTESRGAYIKGEVLKDLLAHDVVPRPCVKHDRKCGIAMILGFTVEVSE